MNRREAVRAVAALAAGSVLERLAPAELLALGRRVHEAGRTQSLRTLSAYQERLVAVIADLIIPATDTPGAAAADVGRFTDVILTEWSPPQERDAFLQGLAQVDARSRVRYGCDFVSCSAHDQVALLTTLDAEVTRLRADERRGGVAEGTADRHVFARLKWFTLYGYYTSQVGQEVELGERVIPPVVGGCVPIARGTGGGR
jgi:hypothetical protein